MKLSYALLAFLAALQAADIWTTWRILLAGGRELNPVMRWLIREFGVMPALIIPKAAVLVVCYVWLLPYWWVLALLCIFYTGIFLFNLRSLKG